MPASVNQNKKTKKEKKSIDKPREPVHGPAKPNDSGAAPPVARRRQARPTTPVGLQPPRAAVHLASAQPPSLAAATSTSGRRWGEQQEEEGIDERTNPPGASREQRHRTRHAFACPVGACPPLDKV